MNRERMRDESIEELKGVISDYRKALRHVSQSTISYHNKRFKNSVIKKVKIAKAANFDKITYMIPPGINSIRLENFYETLRKIAPLCEVCIPVIPTLFLPKPYGVLSNNNKGVLEYHNDIKSAKVFFGSKKKLKNKYNSPEFIFKGINKEIECFTSIRDAKAFLRNNPYTTGMLQEFIYGAYDSPSVLKVLANDKGKIKSYMISNTTERQPNHAKTEVRLFRPLTASNTYTIAKHNRVHSNTLPKEFLCSFPPEKSLIDRLTNLNLISPPQLKRANHFLVSSSILPKPNVIAINTIFIEIQSSIKLLFMIIKNFLIKDPFTITELECEFLKDSSKNWHLLNCSTLKLNKIKYKEIRQTIKPDRKISACDDNDKSILQSSGRSDTKVTLSDSFLGKQKPVNIFSQASFTNSFDQALGLVFKDKLNKVDELKRAKNSRLFFEDTFDLVQAYKRNFSIDRSLNTGAIVMKHSFVKPFEFASSTEFKPQFTHMLHCNLDSLNLSSECYRKDCEKGIESLETIKSRIKK